jgi:toxin-antitoxin system PIN domain toxin
MILDVSVVLYAADSTSPHHAAAKSWLTGALTGDRRIGIPWQTVGGFVRIATHPRAMRHPLTIEQAWAVANSWFSSPVVWVPPTTERTVRILEHLMLDLHLGSGMTTDAQLAALAMEHGVAVVSADADFGRFPALAWINPLDRQIRTASGT